MHTHSTNNASSTSNTGKSTSSVITVTNIDTGAPVVSRVPVATNYNDMSDSDETDYFDSDDSTEYFEDESISDIVSVDDEVDSEPNSSNVQHSTYVRSDRSSRSTRNEHTSSKRPNRPTNNANPSDRSHGNARSSPMFIITSSKTINRESNRTTNDAKPSDRPYSNTHSKSKSHRNPNRESNKDAKPSGQSPNKESNKDAKPSKPTRDVNLIISTRTTGIPKTWVDESITAFKGFLTPRDSVSLMDETIASTYLITVVNRNIFNIMWWYSSYAPNNKMVNSIRKATKNVFTPGSVCECIKNAVNKGIKRYEVFTNDVDSIDHINVYSYIANRTGGLMIYEAITRINNRLRYVRKNIDSNSDIVLINMINEAILAYVDIKHYAIDAVMPKLGRMGILPNYRLIIASISKLPKIPRVLFDSDDVMT